MTRGSVGGLRLRVCATTGREDGEGGNRRECKPAREREDSPRAPRELRIGEPHRRDEEGGELRPRRERDEDSTRPGGRDEPEAPDQKGRGNRVVRVRARDVLRE